MSKENADNGVILVVDDDPENLSLLFEYLNEEGFKILLVQSSEDALIQAEQKQPDIILLDILMPGMDGFETCRQLKENERSREIPVIFMTALSDPRDRAQGFQAGAIDYITKPFEQQEVLARVNIHLTVRRLQQQLEAKNALLEEQVQQLQALNARKDKFISMISHDLQSPFSSLRGLIHFTAENIGDYNKTELENIMDLLGTSTENLYAFIENLLTWSRIQRGVVEYYPQYIDIRESIVQNIAAFTKTADSKQISLNNLVDDRIQVYADYNMVDAIIRNLISNAVKYTNPGGKVTFSTKALEQAVEISVVDNGIGIGKEHLSKLFRIDSRYKRLGTKREKGTGLGLILCKEFVEKNGGKIWIESDSGQGTVVKFILPKKPEKLRS